jgi:hypothetical protein
LTIAEGRAASLDGFSKIAWSNFSRTSARSGWSERYGEGMENACPLAKEEREYCHQQ